MSWRSDRTYRDAYLEHECCQETDQVVGTERCGDVTIRYGYDRSAEASATGQAGQDFWKFRCKTVRSEASVAFAVCDGVGSSYRGDLSARLLGRLLVNHFDQHCRQRWDEEEHHRRRAVKLLSSERAVQQIAEHIRDEPVDTQQPPLIRAAVERLRQYGSETMLAAGSYTADQLTLMWIGNVRIRLLDANKNDVYLEPPFVPDTDSRWSSRLFVRGKVVRGTLT